MDARKTIGLSRAAEIMNASEATALKYAAAGRLRGARIGKGWVFFEHDVYDFVETMIEEQLKSAPENGRIRKVKCLHQ